MQLFITGWETEGENIVIREKRICTHVRQVLRMTKGDEFLLQAPSYCLPSSMLSSFEQDNNDSSTSFFSSVADCCLLDRNSLSIKPLVADYYSLGVEGSSFAISGGVRYRAELIYVSKAKVYARIVASTQLSVAHVPMCMALALPNKRSTLETMIQKLTEIGVKYILIRKAERSHRPLLAQKRSERLHKIVLEAAEQSGASSLPVLFFVDSIDSLNISKHNTHVVLWDIEGRHCAGLSSVLAEDAASKKQSFSTRFPCIAVCGPEGGLTPKDYVARGQTPQEAWSLGDSVLRMETAACIAGRYTHSQIDGLSA